MKRSIFTVSLAALGALWFYLLVLPWPVLLVVFRPGQTAFMDMRLRQARAAGEDLDIRRRWVPLDSISPYLQRAVILAEDGRFEEHNGIDWHALAEELHYRDNGDFSLLDPHDLRELGRAIVFYLRNRTEVRGRSTITQQLAKNLYLSADRSLLRKFDELIVARRLEFFLSKRRILELYLNVAEWGPGVFGAEAAARHYYRRSAARLTREQAAALAATLPHPLTSNPGHRPGRMRWRQDQLLRRMGG